MSRLGGYKPVAHQAPIVLTARLCNQKPARAGNWKPSMKSYHHAQPGMLAFVEKDSASFFYPEPEYFVNIKDCVEDEFTFLGVVQTPGKIGTRDMRTGAGETNVVHAGGTITSFNTGPEEIPANSLVYFDFQPCERDNLPSEWQKGFDESECSYACTRPVKQGDLARMHSDNRIIGRSIRAAAPGQQLDLILSF